MAQIINVAPQPAQNNQQQTDMSQTAPAVAGQASQAPVQGPAAPGVIPGLPAFSLEADQPVDPRFDPNSSATLNDPTASGFSKYLAGRAQAQNMPGADRGGDPLTMAPGPIDRMVNFFSRQDPSKPTIDQRTQTAQFYSDPRVQSIVHGNKELYDAAVADPIGMQAKLAPLIEAAKASPISTANGKTVNDPAGLAAKVQATGMHENAVHPFHEPHQYTEQEFVNATRGLSWGQLSQLMQMQHFVPPQQQVMMGYISDLGQQADKAGQLLQQMTQSNKPKADIDAQRAKVEALSNNLMNERAKIATGATYALPNMQNFNGGP